MHGAGTLARGTIEGARVKGCLAKGQGLTICSIFGFFPCHLTADSIGTWNRRLRTCPHRVCMPTGEVDKEINDRKIVQSIPSQEKKEICV